MENILKEVRDMREGLDRLASLSSGQVSSSSKVRSRRGSSWGEIVSIIGKLAQGVQHLQWQIDNSITLGSHDPTRGLDSQNRITESPWSVPNQVQPEEKQAGHVSAGSFDDIQEVTSAIANSSTAPNTWTTFTAQSSTSDDGVPSSTMLDRVHPVPIAVPMTLPGTTAVSLEAIGATGPARPRRPQHIDALAASEPDRSIQRTSDPPQHPEVTIPYRMEHGVVVLLPLNMDQCCDLPFLLSQAEALSAQETGVFKYVLPVQFTSTPVPQVTTCVSRFSSCLGPDGVNRISRTEKLGTLKLDNVSFKTKEIEELANIMEDLVTDPRSIREMRYCTDIPAWETDDRRKLGLPIESAIWPLRNNQLDRTKGTVDGLHRPYAYISGERGSLFTAHCEDGHLMSLNVLYRGNDRLWYAVSPRDGHLVEQQVTDWKCAQKVRHSSRWISRSELEGMGASFLKLVQRAGEVVVVYGNTYHLGGTDGYAVAEAVNYGPPHWTIEGYSECVSTCPGHPIPNSLLEFCGSDGPQSHQEDHNLREVYDRACSEESQCSTKDTARQLDIEAVKTNSTSHDKTRQKRRSNTSPVPKAKAKRSRTKENVSTPLTIEVEDRNAALLQMVAAISSPNAVKQFFDIVRGRRELEPTVLRMGLGQASPSPIQVLKNDVKNIDRASCKTAFHGFLIRLHQSRLFQHTEEVKSCRSNTIRQACARIPRGEVKKILKDTRLNQRQFQHHRERGAQWRRYHKIFPGILGFLPFQTSAFGFSASDWVRLKDTDFEFFRRHLDAGYVATLCSAGQKFEDSLEFTASDVEFLGESYGGSLENLSRADSTFYLRSVPTTDENIYEKSEFPNWEKPEYWPTDWDWPNDPTIIPPGEQQCIFCTQTKCECACRRPKIQPRIRIYEGKNRGLQAVAKDVGGLAYPKDTLIGYLTGKLVPPDTYDNGKCYALVRTDLAFEPEVAQIDCNEIGNIYSRMNHSCKPTVETRGIRVSGRYRIAIYTIGDVYDAEEITFNYGKGYWGMRKCPCSSCHVI